MSILELLEKNSSEKILGKPTVELENRLFEVIHNLFLLLFIHAIFWIRVKISFLGGK